MADKPQLKTRKAHHCKGCQCWRHRSHPPRKFCTRETVKKTVDGVLYLPGGIERDVTKEARHRRRERIWQRDGARCQQALSEAGNPILGEFGGDNICGRPLQLHEAHAHHVRKRSLGRNDADKNLVTLDAEHHRLYDSQPQWSGRKPA